MKITTMDELKKYVIENKRKDIKELVDYLCNEFDCTSNEIDCRYKVDCTKCITGIVNDIIKEGDNKYIGEKVTKICNMLDAKGKMFRYEKAGIWNRFTVAKNNHGVSMTVDFKPDDFKCLTVKQMVDFILD